VEIAAGVESAAVVESAAGVGSAAASEPELDTLVFFVPVDDTGPVLEAVLAAGGGRVGHYADCAFVCSGTGQFRPLPGSIPTFGEIGELSKVEENRVELVLPRSCRTAVVTALLASHPYEQPAWSILENAVVTIADPPGRSG
jgi:hypothetical protein